MRQIKMYFIHHIWAQKAERWMNQFLPILKSGHNQMVDTERQVGPDSLEASGNSLITWLTMHWSRSWSYTDHVSVHALIPWLNMEWSGSWPYTGHVTVHALITWLIMHWSRDMTERLTLSTFTGLSSLSFLGIITVHKWPDCNLFYFWIINQKL